MTRRVVTPCSAVAVMLALMLPRSGVAQERSLYERLGGLVSISVVVSDFIDALVPDSVLNANPAIDAARQRVPAPYEILAKYDVPESETQELLEFVGSTKSDIVLSR